MLALPRRVCRRLYWTSKYDCPHTIQTAVCCMMCNCRSQEQQHNILRCLLWMLRHNVKRDACLDETDYLSCVIRSTFGVGVDICGTLPSCALHPEISCWVCFRGVHLVSHLSNLSLVPTSVLSLFSWLIPTLLNHLQGSRICNYLTLEALCIRKSASQCGNFAWPP